MEANYSEKTDIFGQSVFSCQKTPEISVKLVERGRGSWISFGTSQKVIVVIFVGWFPLEKSTLQLTAHPYLAVHCNALAHLEGNNYQSLTFVKFRD